MPCDTRLKNNQTIAQRADEVRRAVDRIKAGLIQGRFDVKVGPQGAVVFTGISDEDRDGVTDACIYRRLLTSGSALVSAKIAKAELLAGRSIDKMIVGQGAHSHDGGRTWHNHKG